MDLRSLFETIWDIINFLCDWRFMLCFLAGIALAVIALDYIVAEPLRTLPLRLTQSHLQRVVPAMSRFPACTFRKRTVVGNLCAPFYCEL
jgi:hypothetical protein